VLVALLVGSTIGPPPRAGASPGYRPPVDGEPVDVFRPPSHPYGPGNRGFEYRPANGTPVRAAAAGEVVFAGPVAGALHVTIRHPDGLRTSYSFLATVEVGQGAAVAQGEVVGSASTVLHFGVRSGSTYLDPAAVLSPTAPEVRLVAEPGPEGPAVEVPALVPVVLDALRGDRWATARHYLLETDVDLRLARVAHRVTTSWVAGEDCTPPAAPPPVPAGPRVAVLVGGLGSTSDSASVEQVDTGSLGYDAADVLRFSYAGGRTPGQPGSGPLTAIDARPHGRAESQGDLVGAASALRRLLADVAAARPGVPIDVIAHSQGGVVVQVALTDLAAGPAVPEAVDLVATLGAPHDGTDLATAVTAVHGAPSGPEALSFVEDHLDTGLDPGAPAVAQLSEVSPLMAALQEAPAPDGVRVLTIGARGDLTVPATHTRLWDGSHQVIDIGGPAAHSDLPGHPATTRELALAVAGRPPTCRSALDTLADEAVPEAVSLMEDTVGAAAVALAWLPRD
jgi:hypothetical protein